MGLFGSPNVEKLKAKKDTRGLIKALVYKNDQDVRARAADALGEIGDPQAVDALIMALKDQEHTRQAAIKALGRIGDPRVVDPLISSLNYQSRSQHLAIIVKALKQIGPAGLDELLSRLSRDKDYIRRRAVVQSLGQIKDARVVKRLIATLKDKKVREDAVEALGKIGAASVNPLTSALQDKDSGIRQAAAQALGKTGTKSAVKPLISMLSDEYASEHAAGALVELGWKPGKDPATAAYWVALREWDKAIKIGAPAVIPLVTMVKRLVVYGDPAAIQALIKIGAPAVEALIDILKDKDDKHIFATGGHKLAMRYAQEAVQALGEIGDRRAVEPLINELQGDLTSIHPFDLKKRTSYNITTIKALGEIGDAQAIDPLLEIFNDKIGEPKQAAAEALNKLGWQSDDTGEGVTYWVALKDWNRCVEFGEMAVEPLIRFMTFNKYSEECKKVVKALVQIGEPAVKDLIKILPDRNACKVLGQIGDRRAVEPLLALLKNNISETRRAGAEALVGLYQSGKLDKKHQKLILEKRLTITKGHLDEVRQTMHMDIDRSASYAIHPSDCKHIDDAEQSHKDSGIGIDFPV